MKYMIYTLGCKVNTYESNVMTDILENNGYMFDGKNKVDVVVINSCTVTNVAHKKSIKIIKSAIKKNENAIVIVTGCASQNSIDEIKDIKGVSIIIGNKNKTKIIDYINQYKKEKQQIIELFNLEKTEFEDMVLNNSNKTRAFVKIQDGCNNFCSYCIIPYVRGNVRSKQKEIALEEINTLVKNGHNEIVLTGIHTGNYGTEFTNYNFSDLVEDILKNKDLKRLRISSIEINEIDDKFINLLKNNEVLVDHMHIPIQTGSNEILKLMNRKYDKQEFINRINKIKEVRPNMSITTDVIVGHPFETEAHIEETINTLKEIQFSKLHVFPFSTRKGTKADSMTNHVDDETKKDRVKKLLKLSDHLESTYQNKFINQTNKVLVESHKDGINIGHTGNYLLVHFEGENFKNEIKEVIITENKITHLEGILK